MKSPSCEVLARRSGTGVATGVVAVAMMIASSVAGQIVEPAPAVVSPVLPTVVVRPGGEGTFAGIGRVRSQLPSPGRVMINPGVPLPPPRPVIPGPIDPCPRPPIIVCPSPRPPVIIIERPVRVIEVGSGLRVGGRYTDDRWDVGFSLGSGSTFWPQTSSFRHGTVWYPRNSIGLIGSWHDTPAYGVGAITTADMAPPVQRPSVVAPAPAGSTPPDAAQADDPKSRGMALLRERAFDRAVVALRQHVNAHRDDTETLRTLAMALLCADRVEDAAATLRLAYRLDAGLAEAGEPGTSPSTNTLATIPVDPSDFGASAREWRDLVAVATRHAHAQGGASAWLMVAVLMQAEGRTRLAGTMLDRAAAAGLDPEIVAPLQAELR